MTKLVVLACVLFLACTSQAFTFSRLQTATDETQNDVTSLNDTLTRIQEGVQESLNKVQALASNSKTTVDSATQDTDVSEVSHDEVANAGDPSASQVSVDEVAGSADTSVSDNTGVSENSEDKVANAGDPSASQVSVDVLAGSAQSSVPENTEASAVSVDEVANGAESSVSKGPQPSEVSENTGNTNDEEIIVTAKKLVTLLEGTLKSNSSESSEDIEVSVNSENLEEASN